jgi:hypothetical protein
MKPINWIGMLLIVLNALALAYQGINYTREKKVLDVGQAHLTAETHEQVPISQSWKGFALTGGIVLLVMRARKKS